MVESSIDVNNDASYHGDSTTESREDKVQLQRSVTLLDAVMINVGIMIGSGIFVSPKGVLAGVGSVGATLLVWVACGVFSLLCAMCYAELGTMMKASGGMYTFVYQTYGSFAGFLVFWITSVVMDPASDAAVAQVFSYYALQPLYPDPDCPPPRSAIKLLAVASLALIMFVNCWSIKLTMVLQNFTAFAKLFALAMIIIFGMVHLGKGNTDNLYQPFDGTNLNRVGIAFYSGLFSYSGWQCITLIIEELKRPDRNLPLVIILSLCTVTVVYTLANFSYFTVLSAKEMLDSNAVAYSFGSLVLGKFAWIIPISVVLSCLGTLNGSCLTRSRMFFAAARVGHSPRLIAMIGVRRNLPVLAVIFTTITSAMYLLVDDIFRLLNICGCLLLVIICITVSCLLYLRFKEPNRQRPFKVNIIIPNLVCISCVCLTVLGVLEVPKDAGIAAGITLTGVPVYLVTVLRKSRHRWFERLGRDVTIFFQKLTFVTCEEL